MMNDKDLSEKLAVTLKSLLNTVEKSLLFSLPKVVRQEFVGGVGTFVFFQSPV